MKEPSRGPLGCADPSLWGEIRRVVPTEIPVSVALGEVTEWAPASGRFPEPAAWGGISFAKMGLAGASRGWPSPWAKVRSRFEADLPDACSWVAVIYADWLAAAAPEPDEILAAAFEIPRCAGVLVDTWSKSPRPAVDFDNGWRDRVQRVQNLGRFFAWAGGLDLARIERLGESGLKPDIIAVRGSACVDGNRLGSIDAERVAQLGEAAAQI